MVENNAPKLPSKPNANVEPAVDNDDDLDDLLGDFDDDDDLAILAPVVSGGAASKQAAAAQEGDDDFDPNEHRLEYEPIEIIKNANGEKVLNGFLTFGKEVGKGGFCSVILAEGHYPEANETVPYAVKVYKTMTLRQTVPSPQGLGLRRLKDQIIDEIEFWGKLKHDNIVKAFIWYEDRTEKHDKMYLMLQYADIGEIASHDSETGTYKTNERLQEYLTKKLTEEPEFAEFGSECASMKERIARFIFTQVANGLEYLHEEALVANRDLKPENILFTSKAGGTNIYSHDRAQITDFTTVFKLDPATADSTKVSGRQGTNAYWAPECFTKSQYKPRPLDVWALGVTIYAFMFGVPPFWGDGTPAQLEQEIVEKELDYSDKEVSPQFIEMMQALLCKNPDERPSIREAKARYPWLVRPQFASEQPPPEDDQPAADADQ